MLFDFPVIEKFYQSYPDKVKAAREYLGHPMTVITSYSIHYTKLYETLNKAYLLPKEPQN